MRQASLLVLVLALGGCMSTLQGPEQDLEPLTVPDHTPPPVVQRPQAPPGPTAPGGFFRAWMPRQTAPNGDTIDGHWLVISVTPPAAEVLEPQRPIPRPPRLKAERPRPSVQLPLSKVPPEYLPPGLPTPPSGQEPPPGLPPGMGWGQPGMGGR